MRRVLGVLAACAIGAGVLVGGQLTAPPAQALDLPTWDDVQEAKQNQSSAAKKVKEIESLIAEGEKELDRLRNLHATTIDELHAAEDALAVASEKAANLEVQAEASRKEADEAADRAGALVAQMYRSGGVDRSVEMFLDSDGSTADALLDRMASMSKATERNTTLSQEAEQAANTADTLGGRAGARAAAPGAAGEGAGRCRSRRRARREGQGAGSAAEDAADAARGAEGHHDEDRRGVRGAPPHRGGAAASRGRASAQGS